MKEVTGEELKMPVDTYSLSKGKGDPMFEECKFKAAKGHNEIILIPVKLNPPEDPRSWQLGMILGMGKLIEAAKKDPTVMAKAEKAFLTKCGPFTNDKGEITLDKMAYRLFVVQK